MEKLMDKNMRDFVKKIASKYICPITGMASTIYEINAVKS